MSFKPWIYASVAISGLLLPMQVANAQALKTSDADDEQAAGDIVVTARKREETVLETPVAVTAFNAEQLAVRRIDSAERLAQFTPGLELPNSTASIFANPVIRGITQPPLVTDETSTAVFVDGVYQSGRTAVSAIFDGIERIEVVKGPQSALYGKSSFAGAINYISRKPKLSGISAVATGTVGTAGRLDLGGGIDITLVEDSVGLRVDAAHKETGSTWLNSVNGQRLNQVKADTVRASLRIKPFAGVDIFGSFQHYEDRTTQSPAAAVFANAQQRCQVDPATQRAIPNPASPSTCLFAAPSRFETFSGELPFAAGSLAFDPRATGTPLKVDRATLIIDAEITDSLSFRSLSGWSRAKNDPILGIDQNALPLFLGVNIFRSSQSENRREISQEFRMGYDTKGLRLEAGVSLYDLDLQIDGKTALSPNPFGFAPFNAILFLADGSLSRQGQRQEKTSTVGVYASVQADC